MSRLFGLCAALVLFAASEAGAKTIPFGGSIFRDGSNATVDYYGLDLYADGDVLFQISGDLSLGSSARLDPILRIFVDDGDFSLDDFVTMVDFYIHGNPRNVSLDAGSYILALSDYSFTNSNALAGVNPDGSPQGIYAYTLSVTSSVIAEPLGLSLFAGGLLALGFSGRARRRRR